MLIICSECNREVSDRAQSCPHCGAPLVSVINKSAVAELSATRTPVFVIVAVVALILGLVTPRLLLFFPLMVAFACAIISLFRKEKGRLGAVLVLVLGFGLVAVDQTTGPSNSSAINAAEITSWNWRPDPSFGTRGTIKWNVEVRNKSSRNIRDVKVEFSTYDSAGNLIATTFTFVNAIPPGQTSSLLKNPWPRR
jgi:zinc-ribbon domain